MNKICLFIAFTLSLSLFSQAQDDIRKQHYNLDKGLALEGYDAVSYLLQNKAVKGSREYAVYHQGITYYFSSASNKEEFKKSPARFEPAYGGWCAYAMGAKGEKVSVDPKTFKIIDGKTYLFYNKYFNNTLTTWNKNEADLKPRADRNWLLTFK